MKVLNVIAQKPDSTGSGVYLAQMVACQKAAGHDVAIVYGINKGETTDFNGEGVATYPVEFATPALPFRVCGMSDVMPYAATRYRDMTLAMQRIFESVFVAAVKTADAEFEPDIVVSHHLYFLTALVREALPHRKVGAICHSTDIRQIKTHNMQNARIKTAICNLDTVFALHPTQKSDIAQTYDVPHEKIQIIGTGYNPNIFHKPPIKIGEGEGAGRDGQARATFPACDKSTPVRLLFVGKITFKKGVQDLINALELIECKRPVILECVGGSDNTTELKSIRSLAKKSKHDIRLLGRLDQNDLVEAYRRADIFVLPSFFEGLPLVILEALACGCKVVATDLSGMREWLDHFIPEANIQYVPLPPMLSIDTPDTRHLPLFDAALACAIDTSIKNAHVQPDMQNVTWENLTARCMDLIGAA